MRPGPHLAQHARAHMRPLLMQHCFAGKAGATAATEGAPPKLQIIVVGPGLTTQLGMQEAWSESSLIAKDADGCLCDLSNRGSRLDDGGCGSTDSGGDARGQLAAELQQHPGKP